jgi:hypothetical protein
VSDDEPTWVGNNRRDGVRVAQLTVERWGILRPGLAALRFCPCCGALMRTEQTARLVADRFFPVEVGSGLVTGGGAA